MILILLLHINKLRNHLIGSICDWASENGPSGHTKFDHIFHICCIITNELLKLCMYNFHQRYTISQATLYSLQNINILYRTQDMYHFVMWCILCPLGPFSLARSHILVVFNAVSIKSSLTLSIIGKIMGIDKKNNAQVHQHNGLTPMAEPCSSAGNLLLTV